MAMTEEDAVVIANMVKKTIADENDALVAELSEHIAGFQKMVDEMAQGFQAFVVERTSGIDNEAMAQIMLDRFDEFWDRAIVANFVANKKKTAE